MNHQLLLVLSFTAVLAPPAWSAAPVRPLRQIFLDLDDAPIALAKQIADQQARQQWQMDRGPLYKSTPLMQNKDPNVLSDEVIFEGFFSPSSENTQVALFSDDGCDVFVNGVRILNNFKKGQHLPNLNQSFIQLKFDWRRHQTYFIRIHYSNTIYNGSTDIDGCTLFTYSGGGLCDEVDLDIDSDNNNGGNLPDESVAEERLEDDPAAPGKLLFENLGDNDLDGVPDYSDLHILKEPNFVPIVLKIQPVIDWRNVTIIFRYPGVKALDIAAFKGVPLGNGFVDYTGAKQGRWRIWNVARPTDPRTASQYIVPGKRYNASDLGFTGRSGRKVFYLEAVGGSGNEGEESAIQVEVECTHLVTLGQNKDTFVAQGTDKDKATDARVNIGVNNSNFSTLPANKRPLREGVPDVEFRIDEHVDGQGRLIRDEHDDKVETQGEGFAFWWARDQSEQMTDLNLVDWTPLIVDFPDAVRRQGMELFLRLDTQGVPPDTKIVLCQATSRPDNRRAFLQIPRDFQRQFAHINPKTCTTLFLDKQGRGETGQSISGLGLLNQANQNPFIPGRYEFLVKGIHPIKERVTIILTLSVFPRGRVPNAQVIDQVKMTFKPIEDFWSLDSVREAHRNLPKANPALKPPAAGERFYPIDDESIAIPLAQLLPDAAIRRDRRDPARKHHFISVHGYNVDEPDAIVEFNEDYQRSYWLGFRGNFLGLTWDGDVALIQFNRDIQMALRSSFAAMRFLETVRAWAGNDADKVSVMCHSLGNMMLWDALRIHSRYVQDGRRPKGMLLLGANRMPWLAYSFTWRAATSRIVLLGLAIPLLPAQSQPKSLSPAEKEAQTAAFMKRIQMAENRGHFVISGQVMDTDGKPLSGVQVRFPQGRTAEEIGKLDAAIQAGDARKLADLRFSLQDKYRALDEVITKNGTFKLDVVNADAVYFPIQFALAGYYPEEVVLESNYDEDETIDNVLQKGQVPDKLLVLKTLRVVMEKKGTLTKLEERYVELEVTTKAPAKVIQFTAPNGGFGGLDVPPPESKALQALKENLTVEVSQGPNGTIAVFEQRNERLEISRAPKSLKIRFKEPDSGFLRNEVKKAKPLGRQMKTAPATGYQPELAFDGKEMLGPRPVTQLDLFYFKIGNYYGSGAYQGFRLADDRSRIVVRLFLQLQPDGTRNLETGE